MRLTAVETIYLMFYYGLYSVHGRQGGELRDSFTA